MKENFIQKLLSNSMSAERSICRQKNVVIEGSFDINSYKLTYKVDGKPVEVETYNYGTLVTARQSPRKKKVIHLVAGAARKHLRCQQET